MRGYAGYPAIEYPTNYDEPASDRPEAPRMKSFEFKCQMRGCSEHFEIEAEDVDDVQDCIHCGIGSGSDLELLTETEIE